MVKDAQKYRDTDGWGWGRWRGLDLKPYGQSAEFVKECTGCHLPVRGDDSVYTLPITAAQSAGKEIVNNRAAALPANLPYQPLGWRAITMYVDPKTRAMATLYGNDTAMTAVEARGPVSGRAPGYAAGSVLALVTWAQRDDPHWFGARIPDTPLSVEFLRTAAAGQTAGYQLYSGAGLVETHPEIGAASSRAAFIQNLAPATLP